MSLMEPLHDKDPAMLSRVKQLMALLTDDGEIRNSEMDADLAAASLLVEIARTDSNRDAAEMEAIWHLLKKQFELSDHEARQLLELATDSAEAAICLYQYTEVVKKNFTHAQKVDLVKGLWEVAYADGHLDPHEEASIRKIADLLYVTHTEFIQAKLAVSEKP